MDLPWNELCTFSAKIIKESKNGALLVEIEGSRVWIPKALIDDKSEVWSENEDKGDLIIPKWLAKEKELI